MSSFVIKAQELSCGLKKLSGTCIGDVQKQIGGCLEDQASTQCSGLGPPGDVMRFKAPAFLQLFNVSIAIVS